MPPSSLGGGWGFQLRHLSLRIRNMVSDDAEIMGLCRAGSLVAIQRMFQAGKAST
ncbi:hypothetical protein BDW74DRAFT_151756 [Aspergillus multicolor]|uniref:uncharacterized protein n=1 Tax=Aspergillus multicolor TaxID=41759 RepID=UPI003CCD7DA8